MKYLYPLLFSLCITGCCQQKHSIGWLEKATIMPEKISMKAKLDTGAKTSSVHTISYKIYKKGNEDWVKFKIKRKKSKKLYKLDKQVIRMSKIKEHNGASQLRPVVELIINVGPVSQKAEVNLVDRSKFLYPLLLGRTFIKDAGLIIDPSITFKYSSRTTSKKAKNK